MVGDQGREPMRNLGRAAGLELSCLATRPSQGPFQTAESMQLGLLFYRPLTYATMQKGRGKRMARWVVVFAWPPQPWPGQPGTRGMLEWNGTSPARMDIAQNLRSGSSVHGFVFFLWGSFIKSSVVALSAKRGPGLTWKWIYV